MNALRIASEPLTAQQIAEQVALDCRLKTESLDVAVNAFVAGQCRAGKDAKTQPLRSGKGTRPAGRLATKRFERLFVNKI